MTSTPGALGPCVGWDGPGGDEAQPAIERKPVRRTDRLLAAFMGSGLLSRVCCFQGGVRDLWGGALVRVDSSSPRGQEAEPEKRGLPVTTGTPVQRWDSSPP